MKAIFVIFLQTLLLSQEISSDVLFDRNITNTPEEGYAASTKRPIRGPRRHGPNGYRGPRIQVKIGDKLFVRETLLSFDHIPLETVYDREGNLFFTKVDLSSDTPLSTVMMRRGASRLRRVPGLRNSQGTAVDEDGTVLFATNDGLYYYDKLTKAAKFYALKNHDVFEVCVDKNGRKVVVIAGEVYSVHTLNSDLSTSIFSRVPEADSVSIDSFDTVYYLHNGFVYMLTEGSTQPKRIKELYKDSLSQIAYDSQDNVYIAYGGGLLFGAAGSENFTRVKKIYGGPTSIAFDRDDNFALGYRKKIYKFSLQKLEPSNNSTPAN